MREPEFVTWKHHDGIPITQLSAPYKRDLLIDYAQKNDLRIFVETGTCGGETIQHLLPHFDELYSIELEPDIFASGCRRFLGNSKVHLIEGDSAIELPKLLPLINEPALYWLDAHTDATHNGLGTDNPLMAELHAIISQKKEGIVLVDDMDFGKERELKDGVLRIVLDNHETTG
jgi:hypothetical protein